MVEEPVKASDNKCSRLSVGREILGEIGFNP
jgi:hypothetical protein